MSEENTARAVGKGEVSGGVGGDLECVVADGGRRLYLEGIVVGVVERETEGVGYGFGGGGRVVEEEDEGEEREDEGCWR